jgi:hypothetical protein
VKPTEACCKYCGDPLTRRVQWKRRRYCTAFCREAARDALRIQPSGEQDISEEEPNRGSAPDRDALH